MCKQLIGALVALLALNQVAAAQVPAAAAATPQAAEVTDACALPAVADSIELSQVPESNLVTVPVQINGKPKQFLLAVGDKPSEVSQTVVTELKLLEGLKPTTTFQTGPAFQKDQTDNKDFHAAGTVQAILLDARGERTTDGRAHVIIPFFTLGNATGRNLNFMVANEHEIAKAAPYDGIMTGSFFRQYDVELDFAAMKLNYLTSSKCGDPDKVVFWPHKEVAIIPMDTASGKIEVQVDIAGHKLDAVLDMSSAHTIMRRDIAENTLGLKAGSPQMVLAGDLRDGDDFPIYTATFPQITFASGVTAYNVPALIQISSMFHDLHRETLLGSKAQLKSDPRIPALTLGMDVLRQLHLYIAYEQNNIYMTAAE